MRTLSVLINTLNEERMIENAIRSVASLSNDIVVVDMKSEDRTVEIARALGATVIDHERIGYVEPARKRGLERCSGEWILIIDADEVVERSLATWIRAFIESTSADAAYVPRANYLLGSKLRHTGWGADEDRQLRLFRKGAVDFGDQIHQGSRLVDGKVAAHPLESECGAILHFNYLDLSHFVEKLNRYTSVEALNHADRKVGMWQPVGRAAREFLFRYVVRKGYKDGWRGLYLSICMAFYRFLENAKIYEARMIQSRVAVLDAYLEAGRGARETSAPEAHGSH